MNEDGGDSFHNQGFDAPAPVLKPRVLKADGPQQPQLADFEAGMRLLPPVTMVLIVACIAVFIWQLLTGALESSESIVDAGALVRDRVLAGEWWRLGSATLLHGGFDHLLGNVVMLYIAGIGVEHGLGSRRAGLLYVIAGLGGSLASMAVSLGPSVGASGAIFGLVAALSIILLRRRRELQSQHVATGVVLGLWALWTLASGLFDPFIDNAAHAGGLVCGGLLAGFFKLSKGPAVSAGDDEEVASSWLRG